MFEDLRDKVAQLLPDAQVRLAYVDVIGPTPEDALRELPGPVVIVPAFLASGYHVRIDLPEQVRRSGRSDTVTAPALGPDVALAEVMAERLTQAGWAGEGQVVLAVAGSNDPAAQAENQTTLRQLEAVLGASVLLGTIGQGSPRIAQVVPSLPGPVFIAQYLLADGLFSRKLIDLAPQAKGRAGPLGTHPKVVQLVVRRYREGLAEPRPNV